MAGLYFHIPFCKRACAYCDFYKEIGTRRMQPLLEAMHRELDERKDYLRGEEVRTRYFGGGTPSLCSPAEIRALLLHAGRLFDCSHAEETTLEANPDDLNEKYLCELREAGIDRLSIGIQSLNDDCLKLMNRRHNASQAVRAVANARKAGFDNITVDLIFGVPGFGGNKLLATIDGILSLGVEHISAYHLTIEPNTFFGREMSRGHFAPIAEEQSEEEFLTVHRLLTRAGYEHYEISNFARPGFRARHNASYWHGVRYLGIGPAAHSFDGEERHWNIASTQEYIDGRPAECEHLTERDRYNEFLMTRLRTSEGIPLGELTRLFGPERTERLLRETRQSVHAHIINKQDGHLAIPPEHFLISDLIIENLFET